MKNLFVFCCLVLQLLFFSSCDIDDTTPNPKQRLPFENLNELFSRQDIDADHNTINASNNATITTSSGAKVVITAESFKKSNETIFGNVEIITKELFRKSDMILLNKPSTSNNTIFEYAGIIYFDAIQNNVGVDLQNPISVTLPIHDQVSGLENINHYNHMGTWMLVNNSQVDVDTNNLTLQFYSDDQGWMCGAMQSSFTNLTSATASPFGYGTILTDITGFVVLSDVNTVIKMDGDVNSIKVSKSNIPSGVEASFVIIAMDHFQLFVGIKTLEITDNLSIEIKMNETTEDGLAEFLQTLD